VLSLRECFLVFHRSMHQRQSIRHNLHGNRYYLYHAGRWYRSYSYRGPWFFIQNARIPLRIRRHRWEDIRRYRDIEYRRSDWRNNRYQRNDDGRRRLLEKKYKAPEGRQLQEQPNRIPEGRKVSEPSRKSDDKDGKKGENDKRAD